MSLIIELCYLQTLKRACVSYHQSLLQVPFEFMDCQCSKLNRGVCWAGGHLYSIKVLKSTMMGGFQ